MAKRAKKKHPGSILRRGDTLRVLLCVRGHREEHTLHTTDRREAEAFLSDAVDPFATPLRVLQLRHQTAELLRVSEAPLVPSTLTPPPRVPLSPPARQQRAAQMELSLSA